MTTIISADIVSVFTYGAGRHRAECSCGWEGRLRWRAGTAVMDLADHAAAEGCRINDPLVYNAPGYLSTPRHRTPWWVWTTAAGVIIGAALYYSAPAHADPIDDAAFTATLDMFGVSYSTPAAVIELGEQVCAGLDAGLSPLTVESVIADNGFTWSDAEIVVGAAVGALCDRHMDQLGLGAPGGALLNRGAVLR